MGAASCDAAVEFANNPRYIQPRLTIGWDSVPAIDCSGASVVGGESKREVVVVALKEGVEVGGSTIDVLIRDEGVGDSELGCGSRHELHQALSTGAADGARVTAALCADHAGEQIGVEVMCGSCMSEELMDFGVG